ncbi:DUF4360 domain-containing protein [Actinomadura chibensis]|uniref:DUF4360 domain-containing protein n=1 Tax=Actinomadura chibensis TaxID=392828 RepID=A0A5D0NVI0_9ACTN|nr:DUF4360 domain-containing protein [Actinomadura chibensis]TYB48061.1 DUF4360 domain-containing protein [Actinomadura chibensis]
MRKGIALSAAAAALVMTAASVTPAAAAASERLLAHGPTGVTIKIVNYNGSGCPKDTAEVAIAPTADSFTITYAKYIAQAGGTATPIDSRKSCQLVLNVHVPHGYSYSVSSTEHRGYASLQPGANGTQVATYYFQGQPETAAIPHSLVGPLKKNWQFNDSVPVSQLVWSPCGEERNFNIKTEVRVDPGTSDPTKVSFVGVDSLDNTIKTIYRYTWKLCP